VDDAEAIAPESGDPFAEKFEEEEVVLDNFAGWDDMFRREAPRVQNRRDPEFSALVQAAIPPTDVSERLESATEAVVRMIDAEVDEFEIASMELLPPEPLAQADPADWPGLRLAVVSDFAQPPTPALSSETSPTMSWSPKGSMYDEDPSETMIQPDEEPVLIVEDDHPTPKSPVRREEYRNLFSRLRGS
jgi:hypothetical protein